MLNRMRETIPNSNSPGEVGLSKVILAVKCSATSSLDTSSRQSPIEVDSFGGGGEGTRMLSSPPLTHQVRQHGIVKPLYKGPV